LEDVEVAGQVEEAGAASWRTLAVEGDVPNQITDGAAPADWASRYRQIRSTTSLALAHRVSTFSATAARATSGQHWIVVSYLNCVQSSGRRLTAARAWGKAPGASVVRARAKELGVVRGPRWSTRHHGQQLRESGVGGDQRGDRSGPTLVER
jgi:hypothetical protein